MKQHEHAEVLRAIADGKTLQWSGLDGVWRDFNPAYMAPNPIFLAVYEWRVKPETKPDVVRYIPLHPNLLSCNSSFTVNVTFNVVPYSIKLICDGETNEPKSVEMVND